MEQKLQKLEENKVSINFLCLKKIENELIIKWYLKLKKSIEIENLTHLYSDAHKK